MTFEKRTIGNQDRNTAQGYSEDLQCEWISWRVFAKNSIALDMPADNCCDMNGAIRIAHALVPGVEIIRTFVDNIEDTVYQRTGSEWLAYTTPTKH